MASNRLGETAAYSQTAFLWFNLITLIYMGFKYVTLGNSTDNKSNKIYVGIYLLTLLFVIGIINFDAIKTKCVDKSGRINQEVYLIALMSTFLPWILIFCSLMLVLNYFPGWKSPFSNTNESVNEPCKSLLISWAERYSVDMISSIPRSRYSSR